MLGAIHGARVNGLQAFSRSDRRRETIAEPLPGHCDERSARERAELPGKKLAGRLRLSKKLASSKSVQASASSESNQLGRGFSALRRTGIKPGGDGVHTFRGR